MITLGRIVSISVETNLCCVDIPIFNKTGNKQPKLHATMVLQPGIYGGYDVGDIVFIAFTDNTLGRPIVLGRLYQGSNNKTVAIDSFVGDRADKDASSRATQFDCTRLDVKEHATLPTDIAFSGSVPEYNSLTKLINKISSLEAKITSLETKVKTLEDELDDLQPKSFGEILADTVTGALGFDND
jgi:hypothetical protein